MNEELRTKLSDYVAARNGTRSAEKAAEGFISGKRSYVLKVARETEAKALAALAEWVEGHARYALANCVLHPS
jgi:hypothetical protein